MTTGRRNALEWTQASHLVCPKQTPTAWQKLVVNHVCSLFVECKPQADWKRLTSLHCCQHKWRSIKVKGIAFNHFLFFWSLAGQLSLDRLFRCRIRKKMRADSARAGPSLSSCLTDMLHALFAACCRSCCSLSLHFPRLILPNTWGLPSTFPKKTPEARWQRCGTDSPLPLGTRSWREAIHLTSGVWIKQRALCKSCCT